MSKPFFLINAMPTNDRGEIVDYPATLLATTQNSNDFRYTLITVGGARMEPWTVAQHCMQKSLSFSPLIAVNPYYQHPLLIAKKVAALQSLYPNRLALNIVSGSFFREFQLLGVNEDFHARNLRVREFTETLVRLLEAPEIKLKSPIEFFLSGSIPPEQRPRIENAYYVRSVRPWNEPEGAEISRAGLFFGICTRPTTTEAWHALEKLFPDDRRGQLMHQMAMANGKTPWNQDLEENRSWVDRENGIYSLRPVRNFRSSAPFLVGDYDEVAGKLRKFIEHGYQFFLTDYAVDDLVHVKEVLNRAVPRQDESLDQMPRKETQ